MHRLVPFLAAAALLAACKSDAEKLVDLRTELRSKLDALYSAYGGSALAAQAKADAQRSDGADAGGATVAQVLGQLDRSYFEGFCLARGRGERPFNLSGKLETFMSDPANEKGCREAAKLEVRVRELEANAAR